MYGITRDQGRSERSATPLISRVPTPWIQTRRRSQRGRSCPGLVGIASWQPWLPGRRPRSTVVALP
jgi:hypothetical protein